VHVAIHVALEARALLLHGAVAGQGKNLKATRVSQHGPVPVHEPVDPAEFFEDLGPGAEHQVVGVGEEHLRARGAEGLGRLALHRRLRSDRHEDGRLHLAVQRLEAPRPGQSAGSGFFEGEVQAGHLIC
jgi:hypothetical protein